MSRTKPAAVAAISLIGVLIASGAQAQSAGGADTEIALLKEQLRLMEQKLDKLQKQTAANTTAAAKANAKVDAKVVNVTSANAAYPVKGTTPIDAVVHMPNNRPTICTIGRAELHLDHQPAASRRRRIQLPAQHRGDLSAEAR